MTSDELVAVAPPRPFRTAAVLGAGVMGAQIAAHLANAGMRVELLDLASKDGPKNAAVDALFARACRLRPPPLFTADVAARIRTGNFDEHWDRIGEVDWVVEAVIEDMSIKRDLHARLESVLRADAVVSTNTSGLPIGEIAAERSPEFKRRFLGTHFFNPPRYMRLLEVIPTPATDPGVTARLSEFGRLHLGKGVVIAKDTPNFIANRIGVYAILQAIRTGVAAGHSFEEIDALTGPLIGRPKSATLRTCDVVGLDTLAHVAENLHAAVPDDECRAAFTVPEVMAERIAAGAFGAKTVHGFYKKVGSAILSYDSAAADYTEAAPLDLGDLGAWRRAGTLPDRLRAAWSNAGRAGEFFRETTLDLLGYSARRIPEITDDPADLDRAMRWGFGHELGPFETWDALGFQVVAAELARRKPGLPEWVAAAVRDGASGFYRGPAARREVLRPGGGWAIDWRPPDEVVVAHCAARPDGVVWQGPESALVDLGDGVACYSFESKANTLSVAVMAGLRECLDLVEAGPWRGMVIGNDAEHFSPGANLVEMWTAASAGEFDVIDGMIKSFQQTVERVRYAAVPVVMAVRGRAFGGACELLLACPHPVAAADSYIGLVEVGAGLIPAGGGTMRMAAWAAGRAASADPADVQPFLRRAYQTLAQATVSVSAHHAAELGLFPAGACIVRHPDRHLFVAAEEVRRLAVQGYLPPARPTGIRVLGAPERALLEAGLQARRRAGKLDEHAEYVAGRLAWVITGGDLDGPAELSDQALLDLERAAFVDLLRHPGTVQRIEAIVGRRG